MSTSPTLYADDAFGDPFELEQLPLSRPGKGYAVQYLGRDTLLDRHRAIFLPVRDPGLRALFETFAQAHRGASDWLLRQGATPEDHPLAIVPVCYDDILQRHILIHGVLTTSP